MAQLVQVRGTVRSGTRINGVTVSSRATQTFDLDDPKTRQELGHHVAIGRAVVVGNRNPATTAITVVQGINDLRTTFTGARGATTSPGGTLTLDVAAGTLLLAGGTTQAVAAVNALATTAADATNPRIDIVQVSDAGVVSYKAGTARATGPAAPAPDATNTALYEVTVPPSGSSRSVTLRDVRPFNP